MSNFPKIVNAADSIVISGHTNPDGDCIGACCALAIALSRLSPGHAQKKVSVLLEEIPKRFEIIPIDEYLFFGDLNSLNPDLFIAVDCGDEARFKPFARVYQRAKVKYCIDHHISNTGFADFNHIEPNASSTCEIVYKLIEPLIPIDTQIAAALYAGIVDDTGGFCHSCTTAETHVIAGKLISTGIPFYDIYNEIDKTRTPDEIKGLALIIRNMVVADNIAYCAVSREQTEEAGVTHTDFVSIAEFLLNIKNVTMSFFVYEKPECAKISFRSRRADVSAIAAKMGGGGHKFAAGATVNMTAHETAEYVLNEIRCGCLLP